ncbi:MAG: hypothetical protein P1V35_03485 [Planctomycetota bacterium]|nr:hypothetical protein [Planctomycetota bacterium]
MTVSHFRKLLLILLILPACASTERSMGQADKDVSSMDRPQAYPIKWGPYEVRSKQDARQISILRLGAGPRRKAEYSVFDWVDNGERLRPLYQTELKNELIPLTWDALGCGRFLVTTNEQFELRGTGDNAVVLYDLARGKVRSFRVDDFLPEKWLEHQRRNFMWWSGPATIDPDLLQLYPNELERAHKGRTPWLVFDLPSLSVQAPESVPKSLPKRTFLNTSVPITWDWEYANLPGQAIRWGDRFALPQFLYAERREGSAPSNSFAGHAGKFYYRLDTTTGEYVRCKASDWPGNE